MDSKAEFRTGLEPSKSEVTQYRRRIEARETRYLARVAAKHDSPGGGVCGTRQEADEDLLGIGAGFARNPKASGGRQPATQRRAAGVSPLVCDSCTTLNRKVPGS